MADEILLISGDNNNVGIPYCQDAYIGIIADKGAIITGFESTIDDPFGFGQNIAWNGLTMKIVNEGVNPIKISNNNPNSLKGNRMDIDKDFILNPLQQITLIRVEGFWNLRY